MKSFHELGATGSGQTGEQSAAALQRIGELVEDLSRRDGRGLGIRLGRRALREDVVDVHAADADATADAHGGQAPASFPAEKRAPNYGEPLRPS